MINKNKEPTISGSASLVLPPNLTTFCIAYRNLGELQRAIQDYNEAIHINPQYALAYANRAIAYTLLDKDAEAQQDIDRAVELGVNRATLEGRVEQVKQER